MSAIHVAATALSAANQAGEWSRSCISSQAFKDLANSLSGGVCSDGKNLNPSRSCDGGTYSSQCFAFHSFQPMPAPVSGVGIVNRPSHQRHAMQRRAVEGLPAGGGFVRRELRVCHSSTVPFLSKKSIANASEKFAAVRKGCKWKQ